MAWLQTLKNYILESYGEMKKVTWPTKNQTINYSILVIALSVGLALFFAVLDFGLSKVVANVLSR